MQASVSYTWSHSIKYFIDRRVFELPQYAELSRESEYCRGNSDFDIRHAFTAGITDDVPWPESNKIRHAALGGWSDVWSCDMNITPRTFLGCSI